MAGLVKYPSRSQGEKSQYGLVDDILYDIVPRYC